MPTATFVPLSVPPMVTGEPHIRFSAGFPIESPTRERIGALCVIDSVARPGDDHSINLLQELAMLIQRELWHSGRSTAVAPSALA